MATGRTTSKWVRFVIGDSGNVVREIPVLTVNGVGLTYDEKDVTALQEGLKTVLAGVGSTVITITGPFDNAVAAASAGSGAAPTLSGSHTVLSALGGSQLPRTLAVGFGIRGYFTTNDPWFGITGDHASVGYWCSQYTVDPTNQTYTAKFVLGGGTPAWAVTALPSTT